MLLYFLTPFHPLHSSTVVGSYRIGIVFSPEQGGMLYLYRYNLSEGSDRLWTFRGIIIVILDRD
jgi:hypothetical protein